MEHNSRRRRILQALQKDVKVNTSENSTINSLAVDDIQSFIGKAVYGDHFETHGLSVSERLKHLQGWQTTRHHLLETVFQQISEIETWEKQSMQCLTTFFNQMNEQQENNLYEMDEQKYKIEAPTTIKTPQYIRAMLSLTNGANVTLGPNGTKVRPDVFTKINWNLSNANITRKLLMEIFDRNTLATHTLSGKPSPAFLGYNKPTKLQLDPQIVQDIIYVLTNSLDMTEKEVRQTITTKCADENKMYRQREERRLGVAKRKAKAVHKPTFSCNIVDDQNPLK